MMNWRGDSPPYTFTPAFRLTIDDPETRAAAEIRRSIGAAEPFREVVGLMRLTTEEQALIDSALTKYPSLEVGKWSKYRDGTLYADIFNAAVGCACSGQSYGVVVKVQFGIYPEWPQGIDRVDELVQSTKSPSPRGWSSSICVHTSSVCPGSK